MSTRIMTTLFAGALLVTGLPVLAQAPAADEAPAMTCQQLMEKTKPVVAHLTDATKLASAQKELSLAQADLDSGNQQGCAKHMEQAIKLAN
jgi:hypothetical protein